MAYSDFTFEMVLDKFGVNVQRANLFADVSGITPSRLLEETLDQNKDIVSLIGTEKAWSELLIAPVLIEVWRLARDKPATIYSGLPFDADPAAKLTGNCDFILGHGVQLHYVTAPVVMIVEAKKEDINAALGQCAAAMVGAMRFNAAKGKPIRTVFGCVTTGPLWRFMQLVGSELTVDEPQYLISDLPKLLGIFLHLLGVTPEEANRARP